MHLRRMLGSRVVVGLGVALFLAAAAYAAPAAGATGGTDGAPWWFWAVVAGVVGGGVAETIPEFREWFLTKVRESTSARPGPAP